MSRIGYDSIDPNAIPTSAAVVAGYVDGTYRWPDSAWDRFPNATRVKIAVFATTNDGHVADVETGDMTPTESVQWVRTRRADGIYPTIYVNSSTYPQVVNAFNAAGERLPYFWIAHYGISPSLTLVPNQVAHQYADPPSSGGNYDLSLVADVWPGIDRRAIPMTISTLRPDGGKDHYTVIDGHLEHAVCDFSGNLIFHDSLPGAWSALIDCGYRGTLPYVQGHGTDVGHSTWEVTDPGPGWVLTQKP